MITEKDLDKYFKPEHPWVRNLYCENRASEKLDDSSSRRLATLTSWKPRDDKGHRYHNALVMLNIMPEDVMYHHMYDFVKGWGEKLDTLERTHKKIDVQAECLAYFNPWQLNDSNTRGLTVDDVLSIAILTELTKQGRRDYARATIEKGKALLEEEAYSTSQESSRALSRPAETGDAKATANRITQKRMAQKKTQTKKPGEDREMTDPPRRASRIPTPSRNSSPMSLDGPGSSGKKQTASGGKASRLSRSAASTPAMSTAMSLSASGSSGKMQTSDAGSHPPGGKSYKLSRGAANTPAMTPRGRQSPQSTQPDGDSDHEDYQLYMSRPRHGPDPKKELARMERRAATTPAHIGPLDSPLAYKTDRRSNSPGVRRRQDFLKNIQASARPAARAEDTTGGVNQEDISTESGSISDKENQDQPLGCAKKKSCTSDIPLSPSKRPKDSPTACPPSPPKKNRVSSKMTERSVSPIGAIVINDSEENDSNDDDEIVLNDDDEIQERQLDDTLAGRDISEENDTVPRPNIE